MLTVAAAMDNSDVRNGALQYPDSILCAALFHRYVMSRGWQGEGSNSHRPRRKHILPRHAVHHRLMVPQG